MVAAALCAAQAPVAFRAQAAARPQRASRVVRRVECSAAKKEAVAAGVTAAMVAVMANPMAAQAAATPSLNNLIGSLVAGGVVLVGIAGAVTLVSNFDTIRR